MSERGPSDGETAWTWWESKRRNYNLALLLAGSIAFAGYVAMFELCGDRVLPDGEITAFTTIVQGLGYLLAMGIANLFYFLGPITERIVKPYDVQSFRNSAFRAGMGLSVALPFVVPFALGCRCFFQI